MSIDLKKITKNVALTLVGGASLYGVYLSLFDGAVPRATPSYLTLAICGGLALFCAIGLDPGFVVFVVKTGVGVVKTVTTIRQPGQPDTVVTTTTEATTPRPSRATILQQAAMGTGMMKAVPPAAPEPPPEGRG